MRFVPGVLPIARGAVGYRAAAPGLLLMRYIDVGRYRSRIYLATNLRRASTRAHINSHNAFLFRERRPPCTTSLNNAVVFHGARSPLMRDIHAFRPHETIDRPSDGDSPDLKRIT